jgi:hypothetical protein
MELAIQLFVFTLDLCFQLVFQFNLSFGFGLSSILIVSSYPGSGRNSCEVYCSNTQYDLTGKAVSVAYFKIPLAFDALVLPPDLSLLAFDGSKQTIFFWPYLPLCVDYAFFMQSLLQFAVHCSLPLKAQIYMSHVIVMMIIIA